MGDQVLRVVCPLMSVDQAVSTYSVGLRTDNLLTYQLTMRVKHRRISLLLTIQYINCICYKIIWRCRVWSVSCSCKGRDLGQNLWVLRNSVGTYVSLNITRISFDWADERNDWDWSRMKCNAGKQCGHWQMVSSILLSPFPPLPS